MKIKTNGLAALAGLLMIAGVSGQAQAAGATWVLSGVFNDGGVLSGNIVTNVYGYFQSFDLVTSSGSASAGATYTQGNTISAGGSPDQNVFYYYIPNPIAGQPPLSTLVLTFASNLGNYATHNPIVTGYECVGLSSCGANSSNYTRKIDVSQTFYVPGPMAGTGPLALLGGVGFFWARRRGRRAV